jgi:hypothetical protein
LRESVKMGIFPMARRLVAFLAALMACALSGETYAQTSTFGDKEAPRRYVVVTTLPTFVPPPKGFASDDPRLLVHALGLDMRRFWLSPHLELSFAHDDKLVALDIIGWANVTFTPTSFGGGTLTLSAPF